MAGWVSTRYSTHPATTQLPHTPGTPLHPPATWTGWTTPCSAVSWTKYSRGALIGSPTHLEGTLVAHW